LETRTVNGWLSRHTSLPLLRVAALVLVVVMIRLLPLFVVVVVVVIEEERRFADQRAHEVVVVVHHHFAAGDFRSQAFKAALSAPEARGVRGGMP